MAGRSELTLEEFKARLPLVEIVGRYVRLTKAGRDHKGLCPFHKEKTPSFHVVAEKGFYHCFGCGAHGTALDFVMGVEGLDLAGRHRPAGRAHRHPGAAAARGRPAESRTPPPASTPRTPPRAPGSRASSSRRGAARRAPTSSGAASTGRRPARSASATRRTTGQALTGGLAAEGFTEAELVEAGLLAVPEDGERGAYDRFRHRIMFPIAGRARPRRRLRRPGARRGARQVPEHARHPALPQGRAALQFPPRGPGGPRAARDRRWPRATWT